MIVRVGKIGTGTDEDIIRPDTTATNWYVIEEFDNQFLIEVLDKEGGVNT